MTSNSLILKITGGASDGNVNVIFDCNKIPFAYPFEADVDYLVLQ